MSATSQKRESGLMKVLNRFARALEEIGYAQAVQHRAYQPKVDRDNGPQPIE